MGYSKNKGQVRSSDITKSTYNNSDRMASYNHRNVKSNNSNSKKK